MAIKKIDATLKEVGLSLDDMVKYSLYMKKDAAPVEEVIKKFNDVIKFISMGADNLPGCGGLIQVEDLVRGDLLFEVDGIAAYPG